MPFLIFDLDGTLLDSRKGILASMRHALGRIGRTGVVFDEARAVRQDLASTLRETSPTLDKPFSEEEIASFIREYRIHNSANARKDITVFPDVPRVLQLLRARFSLAVATTKDTTQARAVVEAVGLTGFFDTVQGTENGMRYKPAPDLILATLRSLNARPESAVYIGDTDHDMNAGRAAGVVRIGAAYGYCGRTILETHQPDWLIARFSELLLIQDTLHTRLSAPRTTSIRAESLAPSRS